AFDIDRLDNLGQIAQRLCWLSSGNQLGWIELTYFSLTESLPVEEVVSAAKELSNYGVIIPIFDTQPATIVFTNEQLSFLRRFFSRERRQNSANLTFQYAIQHNDPAGYPVMDDL